MYRGWGVVAGPAHAGIVAAMLTPEAQGAWYALASLQRFQALVDLGMGSALLVLLAREHDPARIGGFVRFGIAWHFGMALVWLLIAGPLGAAWLLQAVSKAAVSAWIPLVIVTAAGMPLLPLLIAVEARGDVGPAFRFRLVQSMRARLLAWAVLLGGGGLHAHALERGSAGIDAYFWLKRRGATLREATQTAGPISFRDDVWPTQWRIGAATAGGALPYAVIVPVALVGAGAAEAGRLGLALAALGAVQAVCGSTTSAVLPRVGALLGVGDRATAARTLVRSTTIGVGTFVAVAAAGGAAVALSPWLTERLPSTTLWALLALGIAVRMVREAIASWCRADLRPVTWIVDLVEGVALIPALALAAHGGVERVATVFLASGVVSGVTSALLARRP